MSITSLTCHHSQSLPSPLCSHFPAEQTSLQIPPLLKQEQTLG